MKRFVTLPLLVLLLFSCREKQGHFFKLSMAEPLRHTSVNEIAKDIKRYKEKGYNAVWIENDYLRWNWIVDTNETCYTLCGNGNWKLFTLYDFTLSPHKKIYSDYLNQVGKLCKDAGLDLYVSFWIPMLDHEYEEYLEKNQPDVFGDHLHWDKKIHRTICTCKEIGRAHV
jgi:hypothetical protein